MLTLCPLTQRVENEVFLMVPPTDIKPEFQSTVIYFRQGDGRPIALKAALQQSCHTLIGATDSVLPDDIAAKIMIRLAVSTDSRLPQKIKLTAATGCRHLRRVQATGDVTTGYR